MTHLWSYCRVYPGQYAIVVDRWEPVCPFFSVVVVLDGQGPVDARVFLLGLN